MVSGDWGVVDGTETQAVFRPSDVTLYFRHTLTQGIANSQLTWTGVAVPFGEHGPIRGAYPNDDGHLARQAVDGASKARVVGAECHLDLVQDPLDYLNAAAD